MRIFAWLADQAACGHYRLQQPLAHLGDGFEVHVSTKLPIAGRDSGTSVDDDWRHYDVIIGQRVCKPQVSELWRSICRSGIVRTVFEVDDDLLNVDEDNASKAFFDEPQIRANLLANIKAADAVTVTGPDLAEVMRALNANVHVLPNFVDEAVLKVDRTAIRPQGSDGAADGPVIGWQGSSTHKADFALAWPAVDRVLGQHPTARLAVFGANYVPADGRGRRRYEGRLFHHEWIHQDWERYYSVVAGFDVGLAPLRDTQFTRGKSNLRVLELAALGIPAVASDVPRYREFVRHGETGFLVRRDHEWHRHLRALVNDADLRAEVGAAARDLAAAHTIQGNAYRWAELYRQLVGT